MIADKGAQFCDLKLYRVKHIVKETGGKNKEIYYYFRKLYMYLKCDGFGGRFMWVFMHYSENQAGSRGRDVCGRLCGGGERPQTACPGISRILAYCFQLFVDRKPMYIVIYC